MLLLLTSITGHQINEVYFTRVFITHLFITNCFVKLSSSINIQNIFFLQDIQSKHRENQYCSTLFIISILIKTQIKIFCVANKVHTIFTGFYFNKNTQWFYDNDIALLIMQEVPRGQVASGAAPVEKVSVVSRKVLGAAATSIDRTSRGLPHKSPLTWLL